MTNVRLLFQLTISLWIIMNSYSYELLRNKLFYFEDFGEGGVDWSSVGAVAGEDALIEAVGAGVQVALMLGCVTA